MQGGSSRFRVSTSGSLSKALDAYRVQVKADYDRKREELVFAITSEVLSRTPVWEGDTIVNWRWSVGAPDDVHVDPVDNGAPGPTGSMPLGVEPRRGVNEAVPMERMREALAEVKGTFADMWLTNVADGATQLEYGQWPRPDRSRQPSGMLRVALRNIMAGLKS